MAEYGGRTAVLVDQHPLWLDAVAQVVRGLGLEVVGTSVSGREGLALVLEHRPDVLVTGIMMPADDLDGLELLRRGVEAVPHLRAIVLTVYDDTDHIDAALAAGALAYVIKTADPADVRSAIRQAFVHSIYLPRGRHGASRSTGAVGQNPVGLTRRELEILRLVAEGHSNMQVAKMLWVTEQTVKFHLSNIYRKLDVSNRTEACRWAEIHGLLATPPDSSDVAESSAG